MENSKIQNVYGDKSIVQKSNINVGNRNIHHKHYIKNGNVEIVVNGFELENMIEKPLFRNTFSVINGKVNNPEKAQS